MYPFQNYNKWDRDSLKFELNQLEQVKFFYVIDLIIKRKIGLYMFIGFVAFGFIYNITYGETKYAIVIVLGSIFGMIFVNTTYYLDVCIRKYRIGKALEKKYKIN